MLQVLGGNLPEHELIQKSFERILLCGWRRDMEDMITVENAFRTSPEKLKFLRRQLAICCSNKLPIMWLQSFSENIIKFYSHLLLLIHPF